MSRRRLGQFALAVSAWCLFGYYWWLVSRRRLNPETITALTALAIIDGSICMITLVWVRHNLRIALRTGDRRKMRPRPPAPSTTDSLGRPIQVEGGAPLTLASYVDVEIDETGQKLFRCLDFEVEENRRVSGLRGG